MPRTPLDILLESLGAPPWTGVLEFKDRNDTSDDEMGECFSALSNEANLVGAESAWIIFGVGGSPRRIIGSGYKSSAGSLNALRHHIAEHTSNGLSFRNVYEVMVGDRRVLMFEIPPALPGVPTRFKGFAYFREGGSRVPLSDDGYECIRLQTRPDWSAATVDGVTVDDLDRKAIRRAREIFAERNPDLSDESEGWSDQTFMERTGAVVDGGVTNSAMVLFGSTGSLHRFGIHTPRIRWMVRGSDNEVLAGEYFDIPLVTAVDAVLMRIRNRDRPVFREGSPIPIESKVYDILAIREALNNCVEHQDYRKGEPITVVERDGGLTFSNAGTFIPGGVGSLVSDSSQPRCYRNRHLAETMARMGMTEMSGGGIIGIFRAQMRRGLALPRYETDAEHVTLTIPARAPDPDLEYLFLNMPGLRIEDAIALDRIRDSEAVSEGSIERLSALGLITWDGSRYVVSRIRFRSIDDAASRSSAPAS